MPRNPPGKKNQHNNRHENGLVGPGKRITKQKSNGHINGSPKGAVPDTPPLTPIAGSVSLMTLPADNYSNGSLPESRHDSNPAPRTGGLKKRDSESSCDDQEPFSNGTLKPKCPDEGQHRAETVSTRNKISHDIGPLQLASTILRSCPAYDTIAILILLLQLPPVILTLVQALFASLTFMPPSGLSLGSIFSLFDVFQGSAGTPSLGTMFFVDVICLGGWYCLWTWAQNFALDLAQVQVAITLGGGSAGKSGSVNSCCVAVVLILHFVRSRGIRQFFFNHVLSARVMANEHIAHLLQLMPHESEFSITPVSPNWLQSLFAVHIVAQACMAFVRRRVANNQVPPTAKGIKRTDTEASAGSQPNDLSHVESGASVSSTTGVDFQSPPTPGLKDGKEKAVSAKKRRRQANQVRSRQPFWAALASTKVTVMREYEHSRGSSRVTGKGLDETIESTSPRQEAIWITHVDPSTIKFEATNIPPVSEDQDSSLPSTTSRPFFVRINGASWRAASITPLPGAQPTGEETGQWAGEICGLAPNCTYTCSFVRTEDDEEFAAVMVKTPTIPDKDQSNLVASPPLRQSLRPSSPTTTIKNSIQTAEAKLNDTRNRLIKARRSHKAALSKIEKEVDSLNTRLRSSSDDTKQRQKLLQAERNIRQTEDAILTISTALEELAVIPEEEVEDWSSKKEKFQKQSNHLCAANEALASARMAAKNELSVVSNELSTITTRRERLVARQTKLSEQHDRITQANAQGLNEKERKAADNHAKESEQIRIEMEYHTQFNLFNREISSLQMRTGQTWQEVQAYEKQMQAQAQREMMLKNTGPLTPEGNLPGTIAPQLATTTARPFGYGFTHSSMAPAAAVSPETTHASPFLAYAKTLPSDNHYRRPRSASNRSGGAVSNFSADFEDADPIPPMPAVSDFDINALVGRKGSGSSREANNGSPGVIGMAGLNSPTRGRGSPGHAIW